jgi:hypothetical protein
MTPPTQQARPGRGSRLWVATSLVLAVTISIALDAVVVLGSREQPLAMVVNIVLLNGGAILQACTSCAALRPGLGPGRKFVTMSERLCGTMAS